MSGTIYILPYVSNGSTIYESTGIVVTAIDTMIISSGGTAYDTIIAARPGYYNVFDDTSGTLNATTIDSGNLLVSSGVASNTVISAGAQVLATGGLAIGTILSSGGEEQVYGIATTTTSATVLAGGLEVLSSGGQASATTVESGGRLLDATGVDNGTQVQSGALAGVGLYEYGPAGPGNAVANNAVVASGGTLVLYAHSVSLNVLIAGSYFSEGGNTTGAVGGTIDSGGVVMFWGGLAQGLTVAAGATEYVGGSATLA